VVWVVLIAVAVMLVAVFAALVVGRLPYDPMSEPAHTTPTTGLPDRPSAADVDAVRFDTAARGYRMSEVDDVLDGLRARLAAQEAELARLQAAAGDSDPMTDPIADPDRADDADVRPADHG
jgi:DivIVA domain-containing protein